MSVCVCPIEVWAAVSIHTARWWHAQIYFLWLKGEVIPQCSEGGWGVGLSSCLLGPVTKGAWIPVLSLQPCGFVSFISQLRKHPMMLVVGSCCNISTVGWAPASCTGDLQEALWFLFYSEGVEPFRWCCSRSLLACFEKYPASVKHLSVKGEEISPLLLFSPNCPRLVWLWLLWVCKIELYMTFYLTRNRLSHF